MTDPAHGAGPPTRWLWVALLVLLAIGASIVLLIPRGEEAGFDVNDAAQATVTPPGTAAMSAAGETTGNVGRAENDED